MYFDPKATQDRIHAVLAPVVGRYRELTEEERHDFRSQLGDYVRLYAFLSQVLTFADPELEKLYQFARYLRRLLPADRDDLPREIQQNIDMESFRIQQTYRGKIGLDRKTGILDPQGTRREYAIPPEELEPLSRIIAELNERFGLNLGPEHRLTVNQMMEKLHSDPAPGRRCPREHTGEHPPYLRPQSGAGHPGDRRDQLRAVQADHRRSLFR
ncbi:MAG: hypothetical protein KatS3mg131_3676 [Candidatus Tectimicrobiota bacterium]|nr:MAG: hypothetical protein KatS3mg131_3676 [Candidatus Tectomicrobia bacterium]